MQGAFLTVCVMLSTFGSSQALDQILNQILPIVVKPATCPTVPTQTGFDSSRYLGTWFEYKRYDNLFEAGQRCGKAEYTSRQDGSIGVVNSGILSLSNLMGIINIKGLPSFLSNLKFGVRISGSATVPDASEPARLVVGFGPNGGTGTDPNYIVVETDYDNYSVVFSCSPLVGDVVNTQTLWILTRVQGQAPANLADIETRLTNIGLDVAELKVINQSDCSESPISSFFRNLIFNMGK